jgi:osmotically-inducible protein OsmY
MSAVEEVRKKDIVDSLYWDVRADASNVAVRVEDGEAILSGTVPSFAARRAAEDDAWTISGIYSVDNQLSVEYRIPTPTDADIRSNVESTLLWSSAIDSSKVEVSVAGGIVTLRGTVNTYWQRLHAETLAEDVIGVLDVINELTVVPMESITDEDIARQIMRGLERNALIDADRVTVAVEGGKVTLTGDVLTWAARNQAGDIAVSIPGVISLENLITVT